MERIVLLLVIALCTTDCFTFCRPNVARKAQPALMGDNAQSDPYGELFNLNKPLDAEVNAVKILDELEPVVNTSGLAFRGSSEGSTERKNSMQSYIEEQFGELDGNLEEDEQWVSELRDVVELKRGFAIWSKRTDQEIKKEVKKSMASKGMNIPHNVASVINAVYVEKVCNMGTIKKEEEIAYTEYKKWVREQRQKLKRDPVPAVKLELVKKWLQRHPTAKFTAFPVQNRRVRAGPGIYSRARRSVVLDEVSTILDALSGSGSAGQPGQSSAPGSGPRVQDGEEGFAVMDAEEEVESFPVGVVGGKGAVSRSGAEGDGGGNGRTGGSSPFSVLSTVPSVVNWHKSRRELQLQEQARGQQGEGNRSERAAEYDVIRHSLVKRIRSAIERRGAPTSANASTERKEGTGEDSGAAASEFAAGSAALARAVQDAAEEYFVVL